MISFGSKTWQLQLELTWRRGALVLFYSLVPGLSVNYFTLCLLFLTLRLAVLTHESR